MTSQQPLSPTPTGAPPPQHLPTYEGELEEEQRQGLAIAYAIAGPLLLSFSILDQIVAPARWGELLVMRIFGAIVLGSLSWALRRRYVTVNIAAVAGLAVITIPISFGGLASGGVASPYLYALILPSAGAPVIVPFRPRQVALITAEIAVIGFVPPLWLHEGSVWSIIPSVSFYACMSLLTVVGAYVHDGVRRQEHASRTEAVRQARLAMLGQMAGALAHELSNPLTAIVYGIEVASLDATPRQAASLEGLRAATDRMTRILDAMRRGARFAEGEQKAVDLNHEIELSLALVKTKLGPNVEMVRELGTLPPVHGNPTLLGQLIVNLLVNAGDALRKQVGARVVVRSIATPNNVIVEVEDNGAGVPEELREEIFKPFASTKGTEGNGLGLWICTEIAEAHGGQLTLHDPSDRGALFRLTLKRG